MKVKLQLEPTHPPVRSIARTRYIVTSIRKSCLCLLAFFCTPTAGNDIRPPRFGRPKVTSSLIPGGRKPRPPSVPGGQKTCPPSIARRGQKTCPRLVGCLPTAAIFAQPAGRPFGALLTGTSTGRIAHTTGCPRLSARWAGCWGVGRC